MKKRIRVLLLVGAMLFFLVSCNKEKQESLVQKQNPGIVPGAKRIGGYKIGFWYSPPTDALSKGFRDVLDYCAKLTNCEMVYYEGICCSLF
jgi:hypothetical protein